MHVPPLGELVKISEYARRRTIPEPSLRTYIGNGVITVYRVPGQRAAMIWPHQADQELAAATVTGAIRPQYGNFGPKAKVVPWLGRHVPTTATTVPATADAQPPAAAADRIGPHA